MIWKSRLQILNTEAGWRYSQHWLFGCAVGAFAGKISMEIKNCWFKYELILRGNSNITGIYVYIYIYMYIWYVYIYIYMIWYIYIYDIYIYACVNRERERKSWWVVIRYNISYDIPIHISWNHHFGQIPIFVAPWPRHQARQRGSGQLRQDVLRGHGFGDFAAAAQHHGQGHLGESCEGERYVPRKEKRLCVYTYTYIYIYK